MATRILWHLLCFLFIGLVGLIGGHWPGMLRIHPSGEASYVASSHCLVSTQVPHERFLELQEWCASIHRGK